MLFQLYCGFASTFVLNQWASHSNDTKEVINKGTHEHPGHISEKSGIVRKETRAEVEIRVREDI